MKTQIIFNNTLCMPFNSDMLNKISELARLMYVSNLTNLFTSSATITYDIPISFTTLGFFINTCIHLCLELCQNKF